MRVVKLVLPLLTMSSLLSFGQVDRVRLERLDSYIRSYVSEKRIPGVAVAVLEGTNVVFSQGYGDGITPQTPFKIGSLSKSVTALAVMQLVEEGEIDLDSPLRRYLPWFHTMDAADSDKVTVRHLLHHRSGLSGGDSHKSNRSYDQELKNLVEAYETMFLKYPPGSRFRYWNTGYDLLGAMVSAVSKMSFPDYVQERIFKPLQMDRSYVSVSEAARHGLAGFRFFFGFPYRIDAEAHHPPIAAGGMISCAEDMGKYVASLMGRADRKNGILNEENTMRLFEAFEGEQGPKHYAMGWEVVQSGQPPVRIVSHGGVTDESHANVAFRPEQKLAVLILANSTDSTQIRVGTLVHGTTGQFLRDEPLDQGAVWPNHGDNVAHRRDAHASGLGCLADLSPPARLARQAAYRGQESFNRALVDSAGG